MPAVRASVGLKLVHTGLRAFSREVLLKLPLLENDNDFIFDNEMLVQALAFGFRIGEISCPTRYMEEASSINFRRSVMYGFGVLGRSVQYRLWKWGIRRYPYLDPGGRRLDVSPPPADGASP